MPAKRTCRRLALLFLLPLFYADCAAPRGSRPAAAGPSATVASGSAFSRLVDDYFRARFAYEPSSGTAEGLHEYDRRLEDYSRGRIQERIAELKRFRERFQALDAARLSFDEAIDLEALLGQVEGSLLDLETIREWERNPMLYAGLPGTAIDSLMKRDFAPAADRLRSVIARLKAVPSLYQAARANLKDPAREFTDLALRMARGSVGFFEGSVARWAREAAGGNAVLSRDFEEANARVVEEARGFAAWLERDLLPRSQGRYAIGEESFLAKLRYEEMVEMPLPDLLRKGEEQLRRDHAAFLETAKKIDPTRTAAEVMRSLSLDHPSAEDLIPSVARSLEAARRFLVERGLVTIPSEVRPIVQETPPYARSGGFASMDTPGPYETSATEAYYYVTPVEKDWDAQHQEEHLRAFNRAVVELVNVHEAYPGHYLQFLYAPRFPTRTRQLVSSGTNVEGWAHYTEQMMVDEGFGGGDPRIRLAQLEEALLRDCRYVVGIKLHTQGMTVEEGAAVFREQGFQEPANAYEEARRGAYDPIYLYYTLGKLWIQELSREYRARKGASLREFHDSFVAQGGLPIPLVRRILLR